MGGSSAYVQELTERLSFVKTEIISRPGTDGVAREWFVEFHFPCKCGVYDGPPHGVRTGRSTSCATCSGGSFCTSRSYETRKLQLTGDMTELEFSLGAFIAEGKGKRPGGGGGGSGVGGSMARARITTLRALRPLLFLETAHRAERSAKAGLPPLVVLHHILVRAPIPLPHVPHGWQAHEYVGVLGQSAL